jgi:hypothetical protein
MASTQSPFLTGATQFVNDVAQQSYFGSMFMAGKGLEKVIQSGPKIKDRIFLEGVNTYEAYRPGSKMTFTNPQTHDTWETEWAHYRDHMSWTEEEILKNAPDGMSKARTMTALKDVKAQKLQRLHTSIMTGIDNVLWAQPNADTMESATSNDNRAVMSIPALINEETNGLWTIAETGTWTTKQGIAPASKTAWKPGQFTYDFDNYTDDDNGLIAGLNKSFRRTEYVPPSRFQQSFDAKTPKSRYVAVTGNDGYDLLEAALRNKGETYFTVAANDTDYGAIKVAGVEVMRYAPLDDKLIYKSGSNTLVTAANASKNGPRFYGFDLDHICLYFHRSKFLEFRTPKEPSDQPETWVQPVVCWKNLVVSSLRRHFILGPVA